MASKSISQLTTTYSLSDNDLFIVSKESGGTFVTYKIPYKSLNIKTTKAGIEAVLTGEIGTHTHSWASINNKPIFATVATSGSYSDLINKPNLSTVAFSGSYTDLTNKPTFKTINGNSLVGNGDIVLAQNSAQVNSDWNATSGVAMILNKPKLATVATSGSYNDLTNKPSLFSGSYTDLTNKPTFKTINGNSLVGNGDIVLAQNSAQVNSDWNATSGVAMILNKPKLATVATSGSYNDLTNKPSLFSGSYTDLTNKPTLPTLATVATTGSYNDLTNKPSLFSGSYTDLTNKPTIPTVGNATITFKQGGVTKGSFTANQTTDVTINLDATTQSGTVSSSDILNTVLTGLDGFQSSGAVVATDSILEAIRKLRDQIAVLTAPPNYGSVSDVGGEGYYPFAVSDGVLYTTSQTITMQPGFYRFVCANSSGDSVVTYVRRVLTGEYLAMSLSAGGYPSSTANPNITSSGSDKNAAFDARGNTVVNGTYSYNPNGSALGLGNKDTFLKYLFNGILNIVKPTPDSSVTVSHIVHIIEPTEVDLSLSTGGLGQSIIWIREVPAP